MPSGTEPPPGAFSRAVTSELRAIMGRYGIANKEVAEAIHKSPNYVSKRLRDQASFTTNDVADICAALSIDLAGFLAAAIRTSRRL